MSGKSGRKWVGASRDSFSSIRQLYKDHEGLLDLELKPTSKGEKAGLKPCTVFAHIGNPVAWDYNKLPHFAWKNLSYPGVIDHHLFFNTQPFGFSGQQVFFHVYSLADKAKGTVLTFEEGFDFAKDIVDNPARPRTETSGVYLISVPVVSG